MLGDRASRGLEDLEGPDDANPVVGGEGCRVGGIDSLKLGVESSPSHLLRFLHQTGAEPRIGSGLLEEAVEKGSDVEARSSYDQGELASGVNLSDLFGGEGEETKGGESFPSIGDIVEMVGNPLRLFGSDLAGADVEAPVDLAGVRIDNLSVEAVGDLDGGGAFSDSCGAA